MDRMRRDYKWTIRWLVLSTTVTMVVHIAPLLRPT